MPDWLQVVAVTFVVVAAAGVVVWRMERTDVWAGLRRRVAERDVVDDAIAEAVDVLNTWPTGPDDELCCGCGECWPQTPTGLPRRVPTGAHDLLDVPPVERAQEAAQLEALYDMPSYIRPPVSPGRDQ